MTEELGSRVSGIGALSEPVRRSLYLYVAAQREAVSREQAAAGTGVPLHTAKFHLDRLVDAGLLEVEFRRLSGRSGPGAGRPSKLYHRAAREVAVSLPERRYDLAGRILAQGIDEAERSGVPVGEAVAEAATAEGRRMATVPGQPAEGSDLERTAGVLARNGYEPHVESDEIALANCPFDALAREHTALVCGMNLALVNGVVEGLECAGVHARLDPEPGMCCVRASSTPVSVTQAAEGRPRGRTAGSRPEPGRRRS